MTSALKGLLVLAALLIFPEASQALLDDQETDALKQTLATYKKTKTLGELFDKAKVTMPKADREFLSDKIAKLRQTRLPQIEIRGDFRVIVRANGMAYPIDFISFRSETFFINHRDVEFLPDESPESKWLKLTRAFRAPKKSASVFLMNDAYAADPVDLAVHAMAILVSSLHRLTQMNLDCDTFSQQAFTSCDRLSDLVESGMYAGVDGLLMPGNQGGNCKKPKEEPAHATELTADAYKKMPVPEQYRQLKGKISQLAQLLAAARLQFRKDGTKCSEKLEECAKRVFASINSKTNDQGLKCYVKHYGVMPTPTPPPLLSGASPRPGAPR